MKFKIGDRIRATDKMKYGNEQFIGNVDTIVAVDFGESYVDFDNINSRQCFSQSELEYE